jgi:hypothetical protein
MAATVDEKKAKPRKGTVGGGRAIGQKNILSGQVKQDIAQFFKNCTSESLRWRQNVRRVLTLAPDAGVPVLVEDRPRVWLWDSLQVHSGGRAEGEFGVRDHQRALPMG